VSVHAKRIVAYKTDKKLAMRTLLSAVFKDVAILYFYHCSKKNCQLSATLPFVFIGAGVGIFAEGLAISLFRFVIKDNAVNF